MKHDFHFFLFLLAYTLILLTSLILGVSAIFCFFMLIKFSCEKLLKFISERWLQLDGGRTTSSNSRSSNNNNNNAVANSNNSNNSSTPIYNAIVNIQRRKEDSGNFKHFPSPEQHNGDPNKSIILCVICLDDMKDGELSRRLPQCNHIFHETCVKPWLIKNRSCPICRLPLLV